jgi:hypothetical protein
MNESMLRRNILLTLLTQKVIWVLSFLCVYFRSYAVTFQFSPSLKPIFCFVDIGGIVEYQCLNMFFLVIISQHSKELQNYTRLCYAIVFMHLYIKLYVERFVKVKIWIIIRRGEWVWYYLNVHMIQIELDMSWKFTWFRLN